MFWQFYRCADTDIVCKLYITIVRPHWDVLSSEGQMDTWKHSNVCFPEGLKAGIEVIKLCLTLHIPLWLNAKYNYTIMYLTIAPTANLTCRVQPVGEMFLTFQMLTQCGSKWKITDRYRYGKC